MPQRKPQLDPNRMVPVVAKDLIKSLMDERGWRIVDLWYEMRELGWEGSNHAIQHITAPSRGNIDARMTTLWYMSRAFGLENIEDLVEHIPARDVRGRPRQDWEKGEGRIKALAKKKSRKKRAKGARR